MSITILHLSDIHAGLGEFIDQDVKEDLRDKYLSSADREEMLERLGRYIEVLPKKPDYVVVSGDMTLRGDPDGLLAVRDWLITSIRGGLLPAPTRIIVTPGNHDPSWGVQESPERDRLRFENFFAAFGDTFPHAHIPGWDWELDPTGPRFTSRKLFVGGLETESQFGEIELLSSHPFLLDLKNDVLIFAFNSSLACGIYTNPPYFAPLNRFLRKVKAKSPTKHIESLMSQLKGSTLVDAGLIGSDQLSYFARLMVRMRKGLKNRWWKLTKIAVLHHHVSHLWEQQLELKRFETVVDAHELKQYLIEHEFDLVLHGHKHTNNVSLDASLIPVSETRNYSPLCIVSGGTVGGVPRTGDLQTFKLIELPGKSGPRNQVVIKEVPLKNVAAPANVIAKGSKIYEVALAPRLSDSSGESK